VIFIYLVFLNFSVDLIETMFPDKSITKVPPSGGDLVGCMYVDHNSHWYT